jgi:ADP-ribosyl-[dinitrogen reductase] hydrolase
MHGSCLCGEIAYEIDRLDSEIQHCACHSCRKAHAAAFNSSAAVLREHFRWLRGEALLSHYESSPGKTRHFCSRCGTQLVAERTGQAHWILRVATLDDDPGARPTGTIWQSHAVPWLAHGDDLPAYPEWQPSRT